MTMMMMMVESTSSYWFCDPLASSSTNTRSTSFLSEMPQQVLAYNFQAHARGLGVIFDPALKFDKQTNTVSLAWLYMFTYKYTGMVLWGMDSNYNFCLSRLRPCENMASFASSKCAMKQCDPGASTWIQFGDIYLVQFTFFSKQLFWRSKLTSQLIFCDYFIFTWIIFLKIPMTVCSNCKQHDQQSPFISCRGGWPDLSLHSLTLTCSQIYPG